MENELEKRYQVGEVAERISRSKQTVNIARLNGFLKATKIGARWSYLKSDVDAWIESGGRVRS